MKPSFTGFVQVLKKPWKSINFSIQNLRPQKSLNFTKSRQGLWKVLKFSFPTARCRFHFVCFWIATVYWKINYAAWSVLFSSTDWRRTELAPKTFSKEIKLKLALQTMYNVLCFHPLFWLSRSPTCIEPRAWSSSQNSPQSSILYIHECPLAKPRESSLSEHVEFHAFHRANGFHSHSIVKVISFDQTSRKSHDLKQYAQVV